MASTWDHCWRKFLYKDADLQVKEDLSTGLRTPQTVLPGSWFPSVPVNKWEEIPRATAQEVWHPSLLKAVGSIKMKSLEAGYAWSVGKTQHGFCKEKPCLTDPPESRCALVRAWREDPAGTGLSGLAKGFDRVPHQGLSRKLTCHRMGRGSLKSTRLMVRTQKARFNGQFSGLRLGSWKVSSWGIGVGTGWMQHFQWQAEESKAPGDISWYCEINFTVGKGKVTGKNI